MDRLNQTLGQTVDPEDYISDEPQNGVRICYFFPLRVEKNFRLLALHLDTLKEELARINVRVGLAGAGVEGLAHMSQVIKKDIDVLIKRITPLKLTWELCHNQMAKSENVEQFCKNLRLNLKCKTVLSQGIYSKLNKECLRVSNILKDKHHEKVCGTQPGQFYRCTAERNCSRSHYSAIEESATQDCSGTEVQNGTRNFGSYWRAEFRAKEKSSRNFRWPLSPQCKPDLSRNI